MKKLLLTLLLVAGMIACDKQEELIELETTIEQVDIETLEEQEINDAVWDDKESTSTSKQASDYTITAELHYRRGWLGLIKSNDVPQQFLAYFDPTNELEYHYDPNNNENSREDAILIAERELEAWLSGTIIRDDGWIEEALGRVGQYRFSHPDYDYVFWARLSNSSRWIAAVNEAPVEGGSLLGGENIIDLFPDEENVSECQETFYEGLTNENSRNAAIALGQRIVELLFPRNISVNGENFTYLNAWNFSTPCPNSHLYFTVLYVDNPNNVTRYVLDYQYDNRWVTNFDTGVYDWSPNGTWGYNLEETLLD